MPPCQPRYIAPSRPLTATQRRRIDIFMHHVPRPLLLLSLIALTVAIIFNFAEFRSATRTFFKTKGSLGTRATFSHSSTSYKSTTKMGSAGPKTPVYFFSHGGPNIMYDKEHPVYSQLQGIGREITEKVKPKAVVVFSAHWRGGPDSNTIEVNTVEKTDLVYDFYNFPKNYYEAQYPHVGSSELASEVLTLLNDAGIKAKPAERGLDHGVWCVFSVAFDPKTNPLNVPIVQVSLYDNESASAHHALGAAVASLRSKDIAIIVSGMAVHNLRDMRTGGTPAYTSSFDQALKEAVEGDVETREQRMETLLKRSDARQAHPTFEHLLPIHIGAGAAAVTGDEGTRLWTMEQGSVSWAQYRFGDVPAAA